MTEQRFHYSQSRGRLSLRVARPIAESSDSRECRFLQKLSCRLHIVARHHGLYSFVLQWPAASPLSERMGTIDIGDAGQGINYLGKL